ncbi:hypothetical protein EJ02DRAFT_54216 [Clathrospora elynae]|uniref:Frequency clock protein n=1 Tax=Clathrospora elynae TaxID=706981 RepID=A0A6A5SCT3_9PLEO|nr:hypothetical protein EJ02DRAFT_54216 [Clathrospora elynae]
MNPRRPPAHQSVSLRQSPDRSSPTLASDRANPPSTTSLRLLSSKYSSAESSDTGRWFDTTNHNVERSNPAFVDNEPPFFLRNSSSSDTPPDASNCIHGHASIPYRPSLLPHGTDGSSSEEYRSVIDDLTIANKRLKQKLKKYETMYDAHMQEEKLFEVRFHGLPDHKKKELEDILRKFAAELDDGAVTDYPQFSLHTPALEAQNVAPSTSRFAESGYASMSASGPSSSVLSNSAKEHQKMSKLQYSRQQQSIHSYLHDIPIGLLPENNIVHMSDKSKKKMVVRRLEQIFAGKRSVPGTHPQPVQQEEVAQSAATADRVQREATGYFKSEGLREARIRPDRDGEDANVAEQVEALDYFRTSLNIEEQDPASPILSPDQRPTRPLDLDPYRAQVPIENMEYIRHLGFTPPDMASGEAPVIGHGWIYLNLLINMAQLHTLNVTPEFVKDALHEYSNHLETSRDGRKIRWKGGYDVTRHSSESSAYSAASPNNTGAQREKEQDKFVYKPLFFRKESSSEDEDTYRFDVESVSPQPQPAGNSSGFSNTVMQSSSSKPRRRDDGPMIFYTKAKFCTDLSGDRIGAFATDPGAYRAITSHPVGETPSSWSSIRGGSDIAEPRGPMDASPMDFDSASGSRTCSSVGDFGFSPDSLRNDNGEDSPPIINFEASGLGGVQPEDNFSIHVRRSQVPAAPSTFATGRRPSLYPKKIQDALSKQQSPNASSLSASPDRVIKEKIISTSRTCLPSSTLPRASFLPLDSYFLGDVDTDLDSNASDSTTSDPDSDLDSAHGPASVTHINTAALSNHSDESMSEEEEYLDDSDDESVDFLATARQQDPKAVRASEREYDAVLADRLAEVIPAGSSAATAGGGSGFSSPADGVLASNGGLAERAQLKRVHTNDSLVPTLSSKSRRVGG